MNFYKLAAMAAVAVGAYSAAANASLMVDASVGGAPTGNTYVNFDNLPLGATGGTSGGVGVTFSGTNGGVVTGTSSSGYNAPPFISNSNGAPFGDSTVSGADTTQYISTGIGSATLMLPGTATYAGLLWGSVDAYNSLAFYNGSTLVGTLSGTDITNAANGNQGAMGTFYANITSTLPFDKIVASSTDYAFEFDNLAFNTSSSGTPAPEPISLSLMGLGMLGIGAFCRKRKSQTTQQMMA